MDQASIEAFLAIYRTRSITRAAETLHFSQSALSQRLQLLEDEIGVQLFSRSKGRKIVDATVEGESFLAIAEQWSQLYEASMAIRSNPGRVHLNIGGVDSAVSHVFSSFLVNYIGKNFLTDIMVRTQHSWEIYELLQSGELDLGIVNNDHRAREVTVELLFTEEYVVVQSGTTLPPGAVHPADLDPVNCIYQSFDPQFARWYEQWFSKRARVRVNTASMLLPFLSDPKCWSIVPISLARSLAKSMQLSWSTLSGEPPKRNCYLALRKPKPSYNTKAIAHFCKELKRYTKSRLCL